MTKAEAKRFVYRCALDILDTEITMGTKACRRCRCATKHWTQLCAEWGSAFNQQIRKVGLGSSAPCLVAFAEWAWSRPLTTDLRNLSVSEIEVLMDLWLEQDRT